MKERPILFSGPMVRAILAGRKTQTRRVVKDSKTLAFWRTFTREYGVRFAFRSKQTSHEKSCPHGQADDRLWVRETFAPMLGGGFVYAADYTPGRLKEKDGRGFWKPSIHMPRAASRLTLEITRVRVERLQSITEADAMAEGIRWTEMDGFASDDEGRNFHASSAVRSYAALWESINGPGSWEANPWVWVIEFQKLP